MHKAPQKPGSRSEFIGFCRGMALRWAKATTKVGYLVGTYALIAQNADKGITFVRRLLALFQQRTKWVLGVAYRTNRRLFVSYLSATIIESLLPAAIVLTGRGLINTLVTGLQTSTSTLTTLLPWLVLGACLTMLSTIVMSLGDYWQQNLQDELNLQVGLEILHKADGLDLAFLESSETQNQIERARKQGNGLVAQTLFKLVTLVNQSLRLLTLMGILLWIEPLLVGWLALIGLPYLLFRWRLAGRTYALHHRRAHKQRWMTYFTTILTNLRWLPEVKFFHLGPLFMERITTLNHEFLAEDRQLYRLSLHSNITFTMLGVSILYLLFGRIAERVFAGRLTVGDVAIYLGSALQLQATVQSLVQALGVLNEQMLYVGDLQTFLALKPVTQQPATPANRQRGPAVPNASAGAADTVPNLPAALGEIEFDQVSFTYANSDRPTLADLSFRLAPGETVALVGENGAGKSTLVKLLARLYEPTTGVIRYDGIDIRTFERAAWQQQMGFVFQNFTSYEATVQENMAYGNWPKLNQSPIELAQLAQLAQVEPLLSTLPQGYATVVGWQLGHHNLSVGQWQRLALARGLARTEARILILDEPSASLDVRAEYEIFSHLRRAAHKRTTLLITHRFSTISLADRILVLEKGRLTESGTHHELLTQGGHYAALYWLQQQTVPMDSRQSAPQ